MPVAIFSDGMKLLAQLRRLAVTTQFYWYLSHVIGIYFMVLGTGLSLFKGNADPTAVRYYKWSLSWIIITYLIVIRETYRSRPISFLFSQLYHMVGDDNVQYLLLACLLRVFASPVYGGVNMTTLQPFTVFAVFHSLSYFDSMILPYIPGFSAGQKSKASALIKSVVKKYNDSFLMVASSMELMLCITYLSQLVASVVFMRMFSPSHFAANVKVVCLSAAYVVFCKLRYDQSRFMQALVSSYDLRFNQLVYGSRILPGAIKSALVNLRSSLIGLVGRIHLPYQEPAQRRN